MDAEALLKEWELSQFKARGLTEAEIAKERRKKADKENLCLLKEMKKIKAWESDISVECAKVYVRWRAAMRGCTSAGSNPVVAARSRDGFSLQQRFICISLEVFRAVQEETQKYYCAGCSQAILQKQRQRGGLGALYGAY